MIMNNYIEIKCINLQEVNRFLEKFNPPRMNCEEIKKDYKRLL